MFAREKVYSCDILTNLCLLAIMMMMMMIVMISEASTLIMFWFPLCIYFIITRHDLGFSVFLILSVLNVIIMRFKTERIKNVSFVKDYNLSRRSAPCSRRSYASVPGSQYGICVGQSGTAARFAPNT